MADGYRLRRNRWLRVSLEDVRAANDLVISYDFDRDGYRIESPTKLAWEPDEDSFEEEMEEVAFIPAWSDKAAAALEDLNAPFAATSTEQRESHTNR